MIAVDTSVFGVVLFVVVILASLIGVVAVVGNRNLYDQIGKGGLFEDQARGSRGGPSGGSPAERDAEIRQMLEARNERRVRQGKAPLDIESEVARLDRPAADPGLEAEVRQLVIARNERRVRQGKAPLDVEDEVARQLRDLGA